MPWDIIIGLALVALLGGGVWLYKHRPTPAPVPTIQTAAAVAATVADTVAAEVAKVPALVSAEVQRLSAELEVAVTRAEAAEAALQAEKDGKQTFVDRVAAAAQAVIDTGAPKAAKPAKA